MEIRIPVRGAEVLRGTTVEGQGDDPGRLPRVANQHIDGRARRRDVSIGR